MSRYIPPYLKELVINRANSRCEYCRISAIHSYFPFHIEHIISIKHGGKTLSENLAYACPICNLYKGTDIATILEGHEVPIRFFNPRTDNWHEHFEINATGFLSYKTPIGQGTIKILNLNHPESIIERREMIKRNIF